MKGSDGGDKMGKKIAFSHDYYKLPEKWEGTTAVLLGVTKTKVSSLECWHTSLTEWDTAYRGEVGHYDFGKMDDCLLLFFFHAQPKPMIFTTIRSFNENKLSYYQGSIGDLFEMVMKREQSK
jgi:hypothetical protein